jgi:hypothetical protein
VEKHFLSFLVAQVMVLYFLGLHVQEFHVIREQTIPLLWVLTAYAGIRLGVP